MGLTKPKGDKVKNDALLAIELAKVIEVRRELDKREAELKDLFKVRMSNLGVDTISIGGVLISLVPKSRTSLDRKALVVAFGESVVSQYEKITEYVQVDIKAVSTGTLVKAA